MKKIFAAFGLFAFSAVILAADPVEGLWKSIDEKTGKITGIWKIEIKEDKLFGEMMVTIGKNPRAAAVSCRDSYPDFPKKGKVKNMPLVGTPFIYNLKKKQEGLWHKGYIIDPSSGKYYYCKITFRPADGKKYKTDTLEMRGEIGAGIGRSQYWKKTTAEETEEVIKNNTAVNEFIPASE